MASTVTDQTPTADDRAMLLSLAENLENAAAAAGLDSGFIIRFASLDSLALAQLIRRVIERPGIGSSWS